jgi:hypothetical protein
LRDGTQIAAPQQHARPAAAALEWPDTLLDRRCTTMRAPAAFRLCRGTQRTPASRCPHPPARPLFAPVRPPNQSSPPQGRRRRTTGALACPWSAAQLLGSRAAHGRTASHWHRHGWGMSRCVRCVCVRACVLCGGALRCTWGVGWARKLAA